MMVSQNVSQLEREFEEHSKSVMEKIRHRRMERELRLKRQKAEMKQLELQASSHFTDLKLSNKASSLKSSQYGVSKSQSVIASERNESLQPKKGTSPRASSPKNNIYSAISAPSSTQRMKNKLTSSSPSNTSLKQEKGAFKIRQYPSVSKANKSPIGSKVIHQSQITPSRQRRRTNSASSNSQSETPHYASPTFASRQRFSGKHSNTPASSSTETKSKLQPNDSSKSKINSQQPSHRLAKITAQLVDRHDLQKQQLNSIIKTVRDDDKLSSEKETSESTFSNESSHDGEKILKRVTFADQHTHSVPSSHDLSETPTKIKATLSSASTPLQAPLGQTVSSAQKEIENKVVQRTGNMVAVSQPVPLLTPNSSKHADQSHCDRTNFCESSDTNTRSHSFRQGGVPTNNHTTGMENTIDALNQSAQLGSALQSASTKPETRQPNAAKLSEVATLTDDTFSCNSDVWEEAQAEFDANPDMDLSDILSDDEDQRKNRSESQENEKQLSIKQKSCDESRKAKSISRPPLKPCSSGSFSSAFDAISSAACVLNNSPQRDRIHLTRQLQRQYKTNRPTASRRPEPMKRNHQPKSTEVDVVDRTAPSKSSVIVKEKKENQIQRNSGSTEMQGRSLAFFLNQQAIAGKNSLRPTQVQLTSSGNFVPNHVHKDREPTLYVVKGKKKPILLACCLHFAAIYKTDCYVLDAVGTLYVMEGSLSSRLRRALAHSVAIDINQTEYANRSHIVTIAAMNMRPKLITELQRILDGTVEDMQEILQPEEMTMINAYVAACSLFDIIGSPVLVATGKELHPLQLASAKAYMLDCPEHVFLWFGSHFPSNLYAAAKYTAMEHAGDRDVSIQREGLESVYFRSKFPQWDEKYKRHTSTSSNGDTVSGRSRESSISDNFNSAVQENKYLTRAQRKDFYSFDELISMLRLNQLPSDIDPSAPENAINRRDFIKYFGMTPSDFSYLPRWKQLQESQRIFDCSEV